TEEDYAATRAAVEAADFHNAFVFRYSPRAETPAADLSAQIAEEMKEARNHDLLGVVDKLARRHSGAYVGRAVEILCEGPSKTNPHRLAGRTRTNKIVVFEGRERHVGELFKVHILHSSGFTLYGDVAPDHDAPCEAMVEPALSA